MTNEKQRMKKMNEDIKEEVVVPEQEAVAPQKKEYMLVVDEVGFALLSRILPTIKFAEIKGMTIKEDPNHVLLVSPKVNDAGTP